MARMFDNPVLPRLGELLEEVRNGTIQIPSFQRGYVWSDEKRLLLMDSIVRGIPIGSLLVWRTKPETPMEVIKKIGPCVLPESAESSVRTYLLDGLQRVTALYSALMATEADLEQDDEGRRWPIYYDLDPEHDGDQRFRYRHAGHQTPATWMPLSCLLDDERFFQFRTRLVDAGRSDLLQDARRLESKFRDYVVPVVALVSDDVSLVTMAFARVNSLGQAMDEGDMAHALSHRASFSLNDELATVADKLSTVGWDRLDRKTIITCYKAIRGLDVYKAGAKEIQVALETAEGRAELQSLPDTFLPAIEVLRSFGVCGPESLPYAYQFVALVRASHRLGSAVLNAREELRRWFFWTTYDEYFTGMTSGQLRSEFDLVEDLAQGRRAFDWLDEAPTIGPVNKLRAQAVRSRAAILAMAIAGDRLDASPSDSLCRLFGALGTEALHRLFPAQSAYDLANRVLATDDEIKTLRAWAHGQARLVEFRDIEDALLRRSLLERADAETDATHRTESILGARSARLERLEREFVQELGIRWKEKDADQR